MPCIEENFIPVHDTMAYDLLKLKVPSHQIRLSWKWYDGYTEFKPNPFLYINFSFSHPKYDLYCMKFAITAYKVITRANDYLSQQHQKLFEPY
jgi:hypothetical protein